MRVYTIALGLSFLFINTGWSNGSDRSDPLTGGIVSVETREVMPTPEELRNEPTNVETTGSGMVPVDEFSQMILVGKQAFEIIKAGAPVVNVKRDTFAVVPKGITEWTQLTGWKTPMTRVYEVSLVNRLRLNVVTMRLKVSAIPGGRLNGRGEYLANVTIVPTLVQVNWGITLDVWSEAREPVNAGSMQDPIAAVGIDLRYRAKTVFSDTSGSQDYFISGDGKMTVLSPNSN
jgi:hypothetical protein